MAPIDDIVPGNNAIVSAKISKIIRAGILICRWKTQQIGNILLKWWYF